ncbi:MAG: hypothetical protein GY703_05465 [Gammaproteobacteria bacterium]|nr:hypothetical protein [Gammaproteobacteria bacterium]
MTFQAYYEVNSWEKQRTQITFRDASQDRVLVVQREIEHTLGMIQDIASFFEASPVVGRREFRKFVEPSIKRHPGIQALAWIPRVTSAQRETFVSNARRSFTPFRIMEVDDKGSIVTAKNRPQYLPVLYVQPYKLNKELLGLDMALDPEVFSLLAKSQESGQLQVSRRIPIMDGDIENSGFMVAVPVLRKLENNPDPDSESLDTPRKNPLRGFALGIFHVGDLVERSMESLSPGAINIRYYGETQTGNDQLIYSHTSRLPPIGPLIIRDDEESKLQFVQNLKLGDRLWKIVCTPVSGRFEPESSSGWIVLTSGFSFTALLTIYVLTLVGHADNVEQLVDKRTAQLRGAVSTLNMEIIERKNAETELQRLNEDLEHRVAIRTSEAERRAKDLEQFAYVTSHDLKAPLRGIANLAQWISDDLQDNLNPDTLEQLKLLNDRVSRMHALIEGLLEYSRVGRVAISYTTVDMRQLLEEIIDSLSPADTFTIDIEEDMPVFETDRLQLGQVFSNLIGNSLKYHGGKSGNIWIRVREKGRFFEFEVADNGQGIAREYHKKVFRMFQTLETRDYGSNTGIGLALVKKIVQEQDGEITLDSDTGKGTSFRFTWPGNYA